MCLYDKTSKKQLEVENDKKAMINQIDVYASLEFPKDIEKRINYT